jgi:hypothetical protein
VRIDTPGVASDGSTPTANSGLSEDQLIGLVRDRLSAGNLGREPVRISSGEQIVDLAHAAERWFAELGNPGWVGSVARDKLVLVGRALLNDGAG